MDGKEREQIRGKFGQQAGQVEQAVAELENAQLLGNETAAAAARTRLEGFGHAAGVDRKAAAAARREAAEDKDGEGGSDDSGRAGSKDDGGTGSGETSGAKKGPAPAQSRPRRSTREEG